MASPQLENGHTRLANELLEAIMRSPLTAREFRVLLAVARETYGWSRKAASVTTSRVATLTGMQPTKAARAIRSLKALNVLANGTDGLGLQKNYETWRLAGQSKSDPGPSRTPNQVQVGLSGGSKSDPIQRKRKQERKSGEPSAPSPHRQVIEAYSCGFREKFGADPDISGKRDGQIIKMLLAAHPLELVLALLAGFFRTGTRWVREKGAYTLPVFKAAFNDLLVMHQRGEL